MYERERTEDGGREEELFMKRKLENQIKDDECFQLLTIDVLPDVFQELENIGGKNKFIFVQWKIESTAMNNLLKLLTDDDKTRLRGELEIEDNDVAAIMERMTKDGCEVLRNDIQTKELNKDKEKTLHEIKKRGDDQDEFFGVAKKLLQQMKRKEEEQKALFAHIQMKWEHDCFEMLPKDEAIKYLEHIKGKGKITYENGISEVVSIETKTKRLAETHLLDENNRETTEKRHGNLGDANSLDVLKQEIPRKDDIIFSVDPVNTYSRLLINSVNKENVKVHTLLKDIVNELMVAKKKVMDSSGYMENVEDTSGDSTSNYCILRNIDTYLFHVSNSQAAVTLKRFYIKIQRFSICPFERMIEYWEALIGIQLMDEDNTDINDNATDTVGLDCEILNTNLGEKHIGNEDFWRHQT